MDRLVIHLGNHAAGEVPENLLFGASTADGEVIVLTDASVAGAWSINGSPPTVFAPSIEEPSTGLIRVAWSADQFATPGRFTANVWVVLASGQKLTVAKIRDRIYTPDVAIA